MTELLIETPRLSEYGKRYFDERVRVVDEHWPVLWDVCKLAKADAVDWDEIQRALDESGVPQMITSGVGQATMAKVIDHLNGKTAFTMPTTVALCLATTAPTSTTTGATIVEAAYTGYTRTTVAGAGFNAATAATPSVATNNGAITAPACTGGTSTLLGFMWADNSTLASGNSLWYGTLASTVISTTQTPPTIASGAMSLSATGT